MGLFTCGLIAPRRIKRKKNRAKPNRDTSVSIGTGQVSRNPIALWQHDKNFPIGFWGDLRVEDAALRGKLRLAPKGASVRIDEIRSLVEAGVLRAVSVGFRSLEEERRPGSKSGGKIYLKSELMEASLVSIPANPNALAIARQMKVSGDTLKMVMYRG